MMITNYKGPVFQILAVFWRPAADLPRSSRMVWPGNTCSSCSVIISLILLSLALLIVGLYFSFLWPCGLCVGLLVYRLLLGVLGLLVNSLVWGSCVCSEVSFPS